VDFTLLFNAFFLTFPPIIAEKKYKLCIFAPKYEIVDKLLITFIISKKISTLGVNIIFSRVENKMSKKTGKKL